MRKDMIETDNGFIKKYIPIIMAAFLMLLPLSEANAGGGHRHHYHGGYGYHWGVPLASGFIGGLALGTILAQPRPVYQPYYYQAAPYPQYCRGEWRVVLDPYGNPVNQYVCY